MRGLNNDVFCRHCSRRIVYGYWTGWSHAWSGSKWCDYSGLYQACP